MFCPNCGAKVVGEQKYCRSCGLGVGKVSTLIAEQLPAGALENASPEEVARLLKSKRRVERALVGLGLTGAVVFVVSLILTIIFKIILDKGAVVQGSIFLAFILGGVVALCLVFYRESLLESLARRGALPDESKQKAVAAGETSKLLPDARFEPVPSVTDRTTELLAVERERTTKSV
jgi:zinc-ribbon domain